MNTSVGSGFGEIAVALETEEGRAFLQRRLSAFGRMATLVSLLFFVVGTIATVTLVPGYTFSSIFDDVWTWWHLGAIGASIVLWLVLRAGAPSLRTIVVWDAFANVGLCTFYALMAESTGDGGNARPDLLVLLILMSILAMRSILVPSSWQQTLLVSTASCIPALVLSIMTARDMRDAMGPSSNYVVVSVASWSVAILVITALASRTIYGLHLQAAKARRLGQYELLEPIGQGGMGVVYRARHALLRRATAIKLLSPDKAGQTSLARFEREVKLTARLTHPNTVSVFDYGRTPDGIFYYAMELLEGIDLQRLVDDDGPQPASRVVHILRQVCGSLAEAHSIGLVHRDIKPGNIILCERGGIQDVAKVVDFGLVKDIGVRGAGDNLSVTDALVGTPLYMAPEAIKDPSEVGPRADLYALGAVGYFLLTGKPPFLRDSVMEICAAHLHEPPPSLAAELGEHAVGSLEELLRACLHKEPEDRPKSALALKKALMSLPGLQPWTEEDASEWWQGYRARHGDDVAPLPSASPPSVLTVSVSDRMTPRR